MTTPGISKRAFSLVELVIVVVIIGILAAIAMPRMSRGATGSAESSLGGNLSSLRRAIDLYQAEHLGVFPDLVANPAQLTQYTDETGNTSAVRDPAHYLGPYVRSVPSLPVGQNKGNNGIVASYTDGSGWIYDNATGVITANCKPAEIDSRGIPYLQY